MFTFRGGAGFVGSGLVHGAGSDTLLGPEGTTRLWLVLLVVIFPWSRNPIPLFVWSEGRWVVVVAWWVGLRVC